ncbi:PqqD family peptide modification chaperone [Rummeliibacillus suwonensis]|uniref:PqqD family peptide modification chaperone n=1 Tax=Rummeliibacillus suwonensis TaxID=1306154 RepID=UPI001AAE63AA|nr:PqqD family peptide modification chaperone [Rummeliibacillus suwonensis]MBO2536775.1 PqqD family peptide modification chaperone [Rummeliibacillus suwonensis]
MIGSMFPVLNARLHLSPDSSFVARLSSERERTGLNKVAAEMLMYCDGTVTVDEIINQIISKYSLRKTSELYNGLVEFFIESKNLGHVVISPEEHKITPIISGSLKYFAPESIQIELTQQCPLKCEHCLFMLRQISLYVCHLS